MREECSKYGQVVELKIPRPSGGSRQSPGVGKIFVKFDSIESATKALKALAGRKFSDRTVVTTYFGEVSCPFPHNSSINNRCMLGSYLTGITAGKLRRQRVVENVYED